MSKNEQQDSEVKYLSESYDKREQFNEIEGALRQVHEFCQRHGIPYIFAACIFNDAEKNSFACCASAHLIGPEKTPPALVVANQCVQDSIFGAVKLATALMLSGYTDKTADDPSAGLDAATTTVPGSFGNA